jgi:Cell morphogenesis central region
MSAVDDIGRMRWARILGEIATTCSTLCPASLGVSLGEVLQRLPKVMPRDVPARSAAPGDPAEKPRVLNNFRNYVMFVAACSKETGSALEKQGTKGLGVHTRVLNKYCA